MKRKEVLFLFLLSVSLSFVLGITAYAIQGDTQSEATIHVYRVLYDNYDGATTNFDAYNNTGLEDVANAVLENTTYGKIEFNENLNLTAMANASLIIDFDTHINISDNLIYVDNYNLAGIGKSANLSFYGISFTDPAIYKQGVICSDCTEISYSGGIYKFKTNSFEGPYYLAESYVPPVCGNGVIETGETCDDGNTNSGDGCSATCQTESTDGGGGGGGGGGATPPANETPAGLYDFYIDEDFIEIEMKKGTYYQKLITVINNGTNALTLGIRVDNLQQFIFPQEPVFTVNAGENKTIRFDVYVSGSKDADVYTGKINFLSTYVSRSADVVLNVKERDVFFDIRTNVLKKYINPGGRVQAEVTIINMGDLRGFDVNFEYKVIDFEQNEYSLKKEDFAINKTYNRVFFIDLPKNISIGNYLFYTRVSYGNVSASSYDSFVVEKISSLTWILLVIIIIILIFLVIAWYRKKKKEGFASFKEPLWNREEKEKVKKKKKQKIPRLDDI